jgi:hypothetical protein
VSCGRARGVVPCAAATAGTASKPVIVNVNIVVEKVRIGNS